MTEDEIEQATLTGRTAEEEELARAHARADAWEKRRIWRTRLDAGLTAGMFAVMGSFLADAWQDHDTANLVRSGIALILLCAIYWLTVLRRR